MDVVTGYLSGVGQAVGNSRELHAADSLADMVFCIAMCFTYRKLKVVVPLLIDIMYLRAAPPLNHKIGVNHSLSETLVHRGREGVDDIKTPECF